ncbi:FAD-dependent oxidoreductase [Halomonas sp. McH1-25]|uniref:NAD(P)/FAD-dependent oxidoreductase n=1 Tax=unclassified Halomonas TaxID=2609666 RepID=UPI001EF4BDD8|nr:MULTISPECIES: FAD-dependent oxidoreductase [unclassified Halomonas]MCG7600124.1 FAD-dependent oxidoreductase [Halomonas sp. McH1-25]MCP1341373.1 FAD-dependent oxidoreductase [Halomonas sp. FL8]MCP1359682.1 FAD-dependent oxidoreductase [Halomonas sp. BBD45]MCP1366344.1 FAD-dependent oxidoreductase [Halomonas sp. BBD48]
MRTHETQPSNDEHLVIVGNGMAGHRLLEALLKHEQRPQRITMIGGERAPAYNRILLSPWLAGEAERDALTLRETDWYAEQQVDLILGERVTDIDRAQRRIVTDSGREFIYDRLVLATGSRPAIPDVPGADLAGVHGFRDLDDAAALTHIAQNASDTANRAVVVGGGLLGLEAAEGLRKRGMQVTVLQRSQQLMNRQLDATAATLLQDELERRGLNIITGANLASFEDDAQGHISAVRLADGRRLDADCAVIAAGIVPNAELGRHTGLTTARGIVVDAWLTTSDANIHALGECCEFEGQTYGLVEPIWRQVEVLAARLCRDSIDGYVEAPTATKLKVSGVSLYAFGPIEPDEEHEVLTYHDPQQGDYRRLLLRNNRIEGAVLYGDTAFGPWYFEQSLAGRDLGACRRALLFGAGDAKPLLEEAA